MPTNKVEFEKSETTSSILYSIYDKTTRQGHTVLKNKNEKERKFPFKTGPKSQVTIHVQRAFTYCPIINPLKTNSHYLPIWAVCLIEAAVFSVRYKLNLCM